MLKHCLFFIIFLCGLSQAFAVTPLEGRWQTYDDEHRPSSVILIHAVGDELQGQIVALNDLPGRERQPLCSACEGKNHLQPVLGLTIIWGVNSHDLNQPGYVLDPENGHIYRATLTLQDDQLLIRGYLGIPMFGRSVTWTRYH